MARQALDFIRRNANVISTLVGLLLTCVVVIWNSGRNYQSLENKMSGLQTQIVDLRGVVEKQDGRINGHDARLRDVEAYKYSISRIDTAITSIFEKLGASDARLQKLEDLVKINEQVKINTTRIDRLETFMLESSKDRAGINGKLDTIQKALENLMNMHLTK